MIVFPLVFFLFGVESLDLQNLGALPAGPTENVDTGGAVGGNTETASKGASIVTDGSEIARIRTFGVRRTSPLNLDDDAETADKIETLASSMIDQMQDFQTGGQKHQLYKVSRAYTYSIGGDKYYEMYFVVGEKSCSTWRPPITVWDILPVRSDASISRRVKRLDLNDNFSTKYSGCYVKSNGSFAAARSINNADRNFTVITRTFNVRTFYKSSSREASERGFSLPDPSFVVDRGP
uniref:Uncharacterized protein n=1 Tax=Romanomermis culicivorax TaxID=13658 RepID=A0A915IJR8_ROMCU